MAASRVHVERKRFNGLVEVWPDRDVPLSLVDIALYEIVIGAIVFVRLEAGGLASSSAHWKDRRCLNGHTLSTKTLATAATICGLQRSIACSSSDERLMLSERLPGLMAERMARVGVGLCGTTSTLCQRVWAPGGAETFAVYWSYSEKGTAL